MFPNPNQQAYSLNTGTCNTTNYVVNQRNPTANDVFYRIGTFWINQLGVSLWYLNNQSNAITLANPTGALQSTWELVSLSTVLASLSDNSGTVVFPSSSSATPPDNIQFLSGGGLTIVANPANNTITFTAATGGFTWSDQAASFAAVAENGYFITAAATATLPASPVEGATISFIVDTTSNLTIQANTGQHIRIATKLSASGGTAVNTQQGDSVTLVYRLADTTWISLNGNGGFNVT